ncbi:RecF/RecN/SMC [Mycena floridula]|nr:RecF/RecN/SMC [Mycena floridula]
MHIKTLTIQGFKSYRDQTQIEPFSPGHNVVVGRNGSGKSNFFAAIRFVLSDAYTSMGREDRQALLHEGTGTTSTLSAFVEITFDNSTSRFPTGLPETVLRRTIGLKKDEYSLDKKSVSRADVMNLLESAGFSKSNPYYIVPQGRITALTNAKDHERLALLKEVAGTKVYETRRTESLRIMAETQAKRAKIVELLSYIETRLEELEEEKEELKEYMTTDRDRRCLEYALHSRELAEVTAALSALEADHQQETHNSNMRREEYADRESEVRKLKAEIKEVGRRIEEVARERTDTLSEVEDLTRKRTEAQLGIRDLEEQGTQDDLLQELETAERELEIKQVNLENVKSKWEEACQKEAKARRQLEEQKEILAGLFAKKGRVKRFKSKAARDAFLNSEITSIESYLESQTLALSTTQGSITSSQTTLAGLSASIKQTGDKISASRDRGRSIQEKVEELKKQREAKTEERRDLWREESKLDVTVSRALEEVRSGEGAVGSDKDTSLALRAIDKMGDLDGVYGPLYRLFEVDDHKYGTAVEGVAGNSLFHIVVDTDATAQTVLSSLLTQKAGRVTFMPLNRLKPKSTALNIQDEDVVPIISTLSFSADHPNAPNHSQAKAFQANPLHAKALQQVFGRTCVCKDLPSAAVCIKAHPEVNTITIHGDRIDRRGALTGGYHDPRQSRLEAIRNLSTWRRKYEAEKAKAEDVKARIQVLENEIGALTGEIVKKENEVKAIRDGRERLLGEGTAMQTEKDEIEARILKLKADEADLTTEMEGLEAKMRAFRKELKTPLNADLSAQELEMLESVPLEIETLTATLAQYTSERLQIEGRRNTIDVEVKEGLGRRVGVLKAKAMAIGETETDRGSLDTKKAELRTLERAIQSAKKRTEAAEKESEETTAKLSNLQKALEKVQAIQSTDSQAISKTQKTAERYLAKRQMLVGRKEECMRNVRDLGVLPEEAFEKYMEERIDKLVKALHRTNEALKKYGHVNKKAHEQYANFGKQRDGLIARREDLDRAAESIEELVEVLDQRKDEAIERTFRQVASHFEEVFEKLVPAGRGQLVIQRRVDQDEAPEVEDEETQTTSIDSYTGIAIKVSFNSKSDEGLRIQQLSGGQKSLVALATVFAIQKCDPAPFYLFDEIDANLDAQYRTAVAAMIKSLSSTGQFITTTFRPEMLVSADKFYGVLFNNQKVSSIRAIRREEAMEFVDQEAQAQ